MPGPYSEQELAFQADNIGGHDHEQRSLQLQRGEAAHHAEGWKRTDELFGKLEKSIENVPARKRLVPGRQGSLRTRCTQGRSNTQMHQPGAASEATLPWTIVPRPRRRQRPRARLHHGAVLLDCQRHRDCLGRSDPYLEQAVAFANDRLWGTLSALLVVHPDTLKDPKVRDAFEHALSKLRYGAVGVNIWPAIAFALGSTPWGAYPGATLTNIQSGRGFVHNTSMVEKIEKTICRYPVTGFPKLPYFPTHRSSHLLGRKLVGFEPSQSWFKLPGVVASAMRA